MEFYNNPNHTITNNSLKFWLDLAALYTACSNKIFSHYWVYIFVFYAHLCDYLDKNDEPKPKSDTEICQRSVTSLLAISHLQPCRVSLSSELISCFSWPYSAILPVHLNAFDSEYLNDNNKFYWNGIYAYIYSHQ